MKTVLIAAGTLVAAGALYVGYRMTRNPAGTQITKTPKQPPAGQYVPPTPQPDPTAQQITAVGNVAQGLGGLALGFYNSYQQNSGGDLGGSDVQSDFSEF